MLYVFIAVLFYMEELLAMAPDWVNGVRSGEERFKIQNGTTILFRQIARDCAEVTALLERDLEREFGQLVKYTTEIVYSDEQGCAMTVSVTGKPQPIESGIKNALLQKARTAQKHAYVGLSRSDFIKFTKDKSPIIANTDPFSYCLRAVNAVQESIHGMVHVCWKDNVVQAYCVPKAEGCWKKDP